MSRLLDGRVKWRDEEDQIAFSGLPPSGRVITCALRWYDRLNPSLRDVRELLLERGVNVSYESIRNWCGRFGAQFARCAKAARGKPGSAWHRDEVFLKLQNEPYVLWRAVDEHGIELDVLRQKAARQSGGQTLLHEGTAFAPGAPKDRHRSTAQLPGGEG